MKKEFIEPKIEVIDLVNEDIVTSSGGLKEVGFGGLNYGQRK